MSLKSQTIEVGIMGFESRKSKAMQIFFSEFVVLWTFRCMLKFSLPLLFMTRYFDDNLNKAFDDENDVDSIPFFFCIYLIVE